MNRGCMLCKILRVLTLEYVIGRFINYLNLREDSSFSILSMVLWQLF